MASAQSQPLEGLIGRVPEPARDSVALLRAANGAPASMELARKLCTDAAWEQTPLGDLFPGLESIETPDGAFPPPISARAANCLLCAKVTNWYVLAGWTPADIVPGLGSTTQAEVLRVTLQSWADFHLGERVARNPPAVYGDLLALSAWGASTRGTRGAVAAILAAAETDEDLPPQVTRAMRTLRRIGESEEQSLSSLGHAFHELEETPGFIVFTRRCDETLARRPALEEFARELGVSRSRVGQIEASFKQRLERQMREPDWPIRLAAEELRDRLGAVARRDELDRAFAELDPGQVLKPGVHQQRRALLLWLCNYRVGDEWVLGPDIESLTDIILTSVADGEQTDLDAASRHLARLGVREELQLVWILSRSGFRIIDGQIVRG